MAGPTTYAAQLLSGTAGTNIKFHSTEFDSFTGGQTLWLSQFYKADRTTGSGILTLRCKCRWFNSVGTELTATYNDISINADVDWTWVEHSHVAPATAVRGMVQYEAIPAASPMQHDLMIAKVRLDHHQLKATSNNVAYSSSAPSGPQDGDIWVDTSTTPNVTKVRVSGAWQVAGNYTTNTNQLTDGANLGGTAAWSGVSGSGKPEDNATLGANWATNVTNIPYDKVLNNDDSTTLGFNGSFEQWTGTYPQGWGVWTTGTGFSKETSIVRFGSNAVKIVAAGSDVGMQSAVTSFATPMPAGTVLAGNIDFYLSAYTSGKPLILVRLFTNSGLTTYVDNHVVPPATTTGTWQTVPWVARVGSGQQIYGLHIYVMGSWNGGVSGAFTGTVIFDRLNFAFLNSSLDNQQITIAANGTLSGGGGGTVTISGLGYSGDLNATYGANLATNVSNNNLNYIADGGGFARILATQLTSGAHKIGIAGSGFRIGDQRNLPAITAQNLSYKFTGGISYTATAGTPATATISVAAGSSYIGSTTINYSALSVGVTGTNSTTVLYYLYVDDAAYAGGSQTLVATTNGNVIYQNDARVYIGSVSVTFPASGGGSGGGEGGGGGYCVATDSWVETMDGFKRAEEIVAGDMLRCLTDDLTDWEWAPVLSNGTKPQPAVRLTSASGAQVICSESTPITLRDGSAIAPWAVRGHELPVWVNGQLDWEPCQAELLGEVDVAYISLGGLVYAAGVTQDAQIFTHNPTNPKP